MAKSKISIDIKCANSALARFLVRKEEEEELLQIGKRKPKREEEEHRLPVRRGRWLARHDFTWPTCLVDRPRTLDGATSFHFEFRAVSLQAFPTLNGRPIAGLSKPSTHPALDHAKYIERDGAAEKFQSSGHADYIERPDAIEAAEAAPHSGVDEADFITAPSIFSNISDDPFERREYWRAVERCERKAKTHKLLFNPQNSPTWWAAVADAPMLDPAFKEHLLGVRESYAEHTADTSLDDASRQRFKAASFAIKTTKELAGTERAGELLERAMQLPGFDPRNPPIVFKPGPSGRVQFRMIAELPCELSAEDRALIVQNFCDLLGALETREGPDGSERQVGMMYTAVIHAPDLHNDERNYHLHVVAHDRPAQFLDNFCSWDFEVEQHFERKGEHRVRFPYRQPKIAQVSQSAGKTGNPNSGRGFVPHLRREFARITNEVLKARGFEHSYDPGSYEAMGISRTPTEHLGTKAHALEAIGVPTTVGKLNAIKIWQDAERNVERQVQQTKEKHETYQQHAEKILRQATNTLPGDPEIPDLRERLCERKAIIDGLAEDRGAIAGFENLRAKAFSRAERTRLTCAKYLVDIERDAAEAATQVMKSQIEERFLEAQKHIGEVIGALAPHRQNIDNAERDVSKREEQVSALDDLIEPAVSGLLERLNAAAAKEADAGLALSFEKRNEEKARETRNDGVVQGVMAKATSSVKVETAAPANAKPLNRQVIVGPVTMAGRPIGEHKVASDKHKPNPDQGRSRPLSQPKNLTPFRRSAEKPTKASEPEIVLEDISTGHKPVQEVQTRAPAEVAPEKASRIGVPVAKPEPDQQPSEEASQDFGPDDGDSTPLQPGKQTDPAVTANKRSEHQRWDELIERISKDRVPIRSETRPDGRQKFSVPGLGEDDQATLEIKRFSYRTPFRLEEIYDRQQKEIRRIARWIKEAGHDPKQLIIDGRTVKLGDVRPAVRTLMRNWGRHPDVLAAVRAENDRRMAVARAQSPDPKKPAVDNGKSNSASKYPEPSKVHTKAVAEFVELLLAEAPKDELIDAAERVWLCPKGRDDVRRYGKALDAAYDEYLEPSLEAQSRRIQNGNDGLG